MILAISRSLALSLEAIKFDTRLLCSCSMITCLTTAYDLRSSSLFWLLHLLSIRSRWFLVISWLISPRVEVKRGWHRSIIYSSSSILVVILIIVVIIWFDFFLIIILVTKDILFSRGDIVPHTRSAISLLWLFTSASDWTAPTSATSPSRVVATRHRGHATHRP